MTASFTSTHYVFFLRRIVEARVTRLSFLSLSLFEKKRSNIYDPRETFHENVPSQLR